MTKPARRARARLRLVLVRASLPLEEHARGAEEYLRRISRPLQPELPLRITHRVLIDELGPLEYPPQRPPRSRACWRAMQKITMSG